MVETDGRRNKSEMVRREENSRGFKVCNVTLETNKNTASRLPGKHRQQHRPDQKTEHGRNYDQPEARHAVVGCPEMIGVNDEQQGWLEAL